MRRIIPFICVLVSSCGSLEPYVNKSEIRYEYVTTEIPGKFKPEYPQLTLEESDLPDTAWKWRDKLDRYIVINLPSQQLRVFENGEEIIRSRAIIGSPETPTPIMDTVLTHIELRPDWYAVPYGTAEEYFSDKIRNGDMAMLDEIGIRWSQRKDGSYQIWQPPSENHILGNVKFYIKNDQNIYLHDTYRKDLYNLMDRGFSHGCIRIKGYDELASWLMGITIDELNTKVSSSNRTFVDTPDIPVFIVYWLEEVIDGHKITYHDFYRQSD